MHTTGIAAALLVLGVGTSVNAQTNSGNEAHSTDSAANAAPNDQVSWTQRDAFDRNFAAAIYATGWAGDYLGGGAGFRVRWEPFERLGLDVFSEHAFVNEQGGLRHDHPIGFNLYSPFTLGSGWRVRPLFGFCAVFSFFHSDQTRVERVDDVHFGVHAGAGIEKSLGRFVSVFVDAKGVLYFGHGRTYGGWEPHISDQVEAWGIAELAAGIQVHL